MTGKTIPNIAKWLFLAAIYCTSPSAYCDELGAIRGTVRDTVTGERLENVYIIIQGIDTVVTTDSLGRYELGGIDPERYDVMCYGSGYDTSMWVGVPIYYSLISDVDYFLQPCASSDSCGRENVLFGELLISVCFPPFGDYSGTVTDENGQPIAGAVIDFIEADTIVTSDSLGQYLLSVYGRNVTIRCSAAGYLANVVGDVKIKSLPNLTVNFVLYTD